MVSTRRAGFWVPQAMENPARKVTFMPVVDDGLLVGLVSLHGLVTAGL
jgi:CBS domain-containing protein